MFTIVKMTMHVFLSHGVSYSRSQLLVRVINGLITCALARQSRIACVSFRNYTNWNL